MFTHDTEAENNNLLSSEDRGNMPTAEAEALLDAIISTPSKKRCYTVEDLQVILSCGRETVYALLQKHEFRWFRLGGERGPYRISSKSFDEWLDSQSE